MIATTISKRAVAALAVALVCTAAGCKKDGGTESGATTGDESGAGGLSYDPASEKSYEVRGIVKAEVRDGVAMIYHENIPDFVNRKNEVKGMVPMEMGFAIEDGVDASLLTAGAKVAIKFDVRWKKTPPLRLTEVKALDPSTVLNFEGSLPANPPPDQGNDGKAPEHGSGQGGGGHGGGGHGGGGHGGGGHGGGGHGGGGSGGGTGS